MNAELESPDPFAETPRDIREFIGIRPGDPIRVIGVICGPTLSPRHLRYLRP